ncbi:MAG TPA: protein kinase [Terriglobales bacterium]|jgi:serine/threonine-protein kinase|nr:protein kinase [Terriglobales bacterium]
MALSSSSEHWRRLEGLFYQALDLEPEARAAFLDQSCGTDTELRKEVEGLLKSAEQTMDFLQKPVLDAAQEIMNQGRHDPIGPGTELAHYKIISMLGAGGMGEVYLAEDLRLKRKVAIKLLTPALTRDERGLRRFEHEAHAASALNHPNILTIYEFGYADGLHFIASEFIDGMTLRHHLAACRMELSAAIDIAIQIASALAAAHTSGIVHRDIKPDNVIVRNDGIVKVLDFGIAKLNEKQIGETIRRTASAIASSTSEPGMVIGTAKYMSPEQARGLQVDARSDIFSLGAVIYEMVTGREAFSGETASDVIAEILKTEPPAPVDFAPDVPHEVERMISKAIRKDRENRYQTAKDLLIDLQDFKKEMEFQAKLQLSARPGRGSGSKDQKPVATAGIGTARRGLGGHPLFQVDDKPLATNFLYSRKTWVGLAILLFTALLVGYAALRKSHSVPTAQQPRSLAILPFRNLKQDPETDFLGFSLADAVITKVGYISALTVRPSSSVDKYRNQIIDPKKVATDLNVDTLLTGSFIKDGDDLRITTQLVDVKPDKILWQDSIDLKYDKLLTVQDRVAQQIIRGLELNLSPAEAANLKPDKPINSLAYEYYLRGVDLYSLNEFAPAIELLQKSVALEPNYAPTWAHLGRAYTTNASLRFGGREDYNKAQVAYEKAIALNPALVEPRIYMANLLTDTGRVEQSVPLLRSALQTSPNNAEAHWELGYAYRFGGMLRESVAECEKARQNNPQVKINSSALNSYLYLGEYDKFMQSLPVNDSTYILFYHGFGAYYLGNYEQASKDFDRAYEMEPALLPADVGKALSYSMKHENQMGLKLLHETENRIERQGVTDAEGIYKVAQAYAVLGDKPSALHMLEHSIGGGFFCYPYFVRDPLLQNLRNEAEFQALMDQARHRHDQFKVSFF